LVHDTGSLKLLVENQTPSQVVMGLDDPYPLGEMESKPQSSYPGKILDLAIERGIISETEYDAIWEDNVLRWLFGDDQQAKDAMVARILGEEIKVER
jgi:aminocarboxymuconate-semialdehyde decarboxylase